MRYVNTYEIIGKVKLQLTAVHMTSYVHKINFIEFCHDDQEKSYEDMYPGIPYMLCLLLSDQFNQTVLHLLEKLSCNLYTTSYQLYSRK